LGKTEMDGTEQTIFENTELGEYSGYIFLDALESGDSITIRIYIRDPEDGNYKKFIEETFTGKLNTPVVRITPIIGKVGVKVTAEQTSGSYKTITHTWFKR